jgi:hypothetical protein
MAAAAKSDNETLKAAFSAFQGLAPEMRKALLSAVEILDQAPVLAELQSAIEERLKLITPRGKAHTARELLEGWWWPRIRQMVCKSGACFIHHARLGSDAMNSIETR